MDLKKEEKKSSTEWVNLVTFRSYSLPDMGLVLTRVRVVLIWVSWLGGFNSNPNNR
jgi:hypothetical protein